MSAVVGEGMGGGSRDGFATVHEICYHVLVGISSGRVRDGTDWDLSIYCEVVGGRSGGTYVVFEG